VAHAGAARPTDGYVACFGEFEQGLSDLAGLAAGFSVIALVLAALGTLAGLAIALPAMRLPTARPRSIRRSRRRWK
jgi:hypothetical protein